MTDVEREALPAWFGKLACLGDFAGRRFDPPLVQMLDTWLSHCIETSRIQLGPRWLDIYLTSPLWRFGLAPGVLDEHWWFGVLMPSVDNAGRYFPLLVAKSLTQAPCDMALLEHWFTAVAGAALSTLQTGASIDQFEQALRTLPVLCPGRLGGADLAAQWLERGRCELPAGQSLAQFLQDFTRHESLRCLHGCSIWWPLRPGTVTSSLSTTSGFPGPELFAQLLEGTW